MAPSPIGETDLDIELLEIIGAGHRRISNDQSRVKFNSQSEKNAIINKLVSRPRPGPLSKKRKLDALELGSENDKAPTKLTSLASSGDTNITEEGIRSKTTNVKVPSPELQLSTNSCDSTTKNVKPTARPRPGPLSKKAKLQVTKPTTVPILPLPNVKSKDKPVSEKVITIRSDSDDTKTEIVEFERAVSLKSAFTIKSTIQLINKNDANAIQKPKLCPRPRPGPLSKRIELAKPLTNNTQETCTENSTKTKNTLQTSSNYVTKIKDKVKSKVQPKEKVVELDNSTAIKSVQLKQSPSSSKSSPAPILNHTTHHDDKLIFQQAKWKEGIQKLQDEIGVPVSLEMIMSTIGTKKLMDIQKSLNANKSMYMFELVSYYN